MKHSDARYPDEIQANVLRAKEAAAKEKAEHPLHEAARLPVCEKRDPCRVREDGDPEFDGTRWESGMHLMSDLCMGRLPEPCWIRCGRTAMKINPGESRVMGRGIMIGYDVTELSLPNTQPHGHATDGH